MKSLLASIVLLGIAAAAPASKAHDDARSNGPVVDPYRIGTLFGVVAKPGPAPEGVTDLKFNEVFKMPVGPKGLEPTEKLLSLNGKRVRMVGYMVHPEEPAPGEFILSPLPVALAEADDGAADDIPASSVFVHFEGGDEMVFHHVEGLLALTGTLSVGGQQESDGRVSSVRLIVDPDWSRKLLQESPGPRQSAPSFSAQTSAH